MRKKEVKLVITFRTTADAMAAEKACKRAGAPGRLIPVPREISAGCGLAWRAEVADRELLCGLIRGAGVREEAAHEAML